MVAPLTIRNINYKQSPFRIGGNESDDDDHDHNDVDRNSFIHIKKKFSADAVFGFVQLLPMQLWRLLLFFVVVLCCFQRHGKSAEVTGQRERI